MKLIIGLLLTINFLFAAECKLMTSQLNLNNMELGYSSWYGRTIPIVTSETYKYTDFLTAYSEFDVYVRDKIREDVCKKNGWNGVANFKITWQQTKDTYNLIATFDAFAYKQ